jgi:hypothetical protein
LKGAPSSCCCWQRVQVNLGTREACRGCPNHIVLILTDFNCKFLGLVLFLFAIDISSAMTQNKCCCMVEKCRARSRNYRELHLL